MLEMNRLSFVCYLFLLHILSVAICKEKINEGKEKNLGDEFEDMKIYRISENIMKGCNMNIENLDSKSPILLNTMDEVVMPTKEGNIEFRHGEEIRIICPGNTNGFTDERLQKNIRTITASCVEGRTFNIDNQNIDIQNIKCSRTPESNPRKTESKCNNGAYTAAEIGFQFDDNFINLIDICFDEEQYRTVYTKHTVSASVSKRQTNTNFSFRDSDQFLYSGVGDRPSKFYVCRTQASTFVKFLGTPEQVSKYVQCSNTSVSATQFARGHLSPNADFVYAFQQNATYYHANTAPQWQFFNNRNWKALEERIRNHANNTGRDLYVYTGTSEEVTYLPDVNNNNVEIFLSNQSKILPAPLYFWKLVYDPVSMSGIGFIGYNVHFNQNPTFFEIPNIPTICQETSWFKKSEININKSLMYCMPVEEFFDFTGFKDFKQEVRGIISYESKKDISEVKLQTRSTNGSRNLHVFGALILLLNIFHFHEVGLLN